jgi:DNA replication protein DnaC
VNDAMTSAAAGRAQLDHLGLAIAANALDGDAEQAVRENWGPTAFQAALMAEEQTARRDRAVLPRMQFAHLPYRKTLDQFDFAAQPSVDERSVYSDESGLSRTYCEAWRGRQGEARGPGQAARRIRVLRRSSLARP